MPEKLTLARLKKFGQTFEISVDSDKALKYKRGEITDIHEVLNAEHIYSDAKKGLRVPSQELQKIFKTDDVIAIADTIIKHGEIQLTSEHRAEEREQKKKLLINLIHRQAVDPKTNLPLPPMRIELALEQGKIHLDDHKSAEEQFDEIVQKLRPILPIKIEQKRFTLTIPAQFAGKSYAIVKSNSAIIKDTWNNDGSWTATVEIPAGLYFEFLEKLNAVTHGQVMVKE